MQALTYAITPIWSHGISLFVLKCEISPYKIPTIIYSDLCKGQV